MYLRHFDFSTQPFVGITRLTGNFFIPYHQDVFCLLKEKCQHGGITLLLGDDAYLLKQLSSALKTQCKNALTIDAFPLLSADDFRYKLNPLNGESKSHWQIIEHFLQNWQAFPQNGSSEINVLLISACQLMDENAIVMLSMLLSRAREMDIKLAVLMTGELNQYSRLQRAGLGEYIHTYHILRPLFLTEVQRYIHAQCEEHGAKHTLFPPALLRMIDARIQGRVSKLNQLAHFSLLAAWIERATIVNSRHLRIAASEISLSRRYRKRFVAAGVLASAIFFACGWHFMPAFTAALPVKLPVFSGWQTQASQQFPASVPVIEKEVANKTGAMQQLYSMWGYNTSPEEALCQNAARVNLSCKEGLGTIEELAKKGYPWVSEIRTGGQLNYAVVARLNNNSLDLLMNNRTWQVSRNWFTQHTTGNFTLLYRLTPLGKNTVGAQSDSKDILWLDQQLSLALHHPAIHMPNWTVEIAERTRELQKKMDLRIDGIAGEETLMQLMRETNSVPGVLSQPSTAKENVTIVEKAH